MAFSIEKTGLLLLVASIVAMMTRKLKIPYSIGLVATGVFLAFFPFAATIELTKEVMFTTLLPPLIFEAALFLPWNELKKEFSVVTAMASLGVIAAALVTAVGMHYVADWSWISSSIFGVLIAATDPVSVIATFKESGVRGRLRILVEAESLFNDGAAAVLFGILLIVASGQSITFGSVLLHLLTIVGGGIASGALIASLTLFLCGKTKDHLIEITFTTIAAYGSFLFAEHFHMSGVLATLTAGLMVGNYHGRASIYDKNREAVESFWEYIAFVANSFVFLLIGIQEAHQDFKKLWFVSLVGIVLVLLGRIVAVYPVSWLFARSNLRISSKHQHILFWGGLRGALALALALGLPETIPQRNEIITVAFAIVAFSIVVQGLTISPLLRKFGEIKS